MWVCDICHCMHVGGADSAASRTSTSSAAVAKIVYYTICLCVYRRAIIRSSLLGYTLHASIYAAPLAHTTSAQQLTSTCSPHLLTPPAVRAWPSTTGRHPLDSLGHGSGGSSGQPYGRHAARGGRSCCSSCCSRAEEAASAATGAGSSRGSVLELPYVMPLAFKNSSDGS